MMQSNRLASISFLSIRNGTIYDSSMAELCWGQMVADELPGGLDHAATAMAFHFGFDAARDATRQCDGKGTLPSVFHLTRIQTNPMRIALETGVRPILFASMASSILESELEALRLIHSTNDPRFVPSMVVHEIDRMNLWLGTSFSLLMVILLWVASCLLYYGFTTPALACSAIVAAMGCVLWSFTYLWMARARSLNRFLSELRGE